MFRAHYLPSVQLLDVAASVSWSASPRPCELWWIGRDKQKGKKRSKPPKPPLLLQDLLCLLSRFFFLSSPQRCPQASRQDEDLAPPCGRWVSVTVIDPTIFWLINTFKLAIRPKCFFFFIHLKWKTYFTAVVRPEILK